MKKIDLIVRWLMEESNPLTGLKGVVATVTVSYGALLLFFRGVLGSSLFISDDRSYWDDSLVWWEPFNPFHLPAYPWLIAATRGLTH